MKVVQGHLVRGAKLVEQRLLGGELVVVVVTVGGGEVEVDYKEVVKVEERVAGNLEAGAGSHLRWYV